MYAWAANADVERPHTCSCMTGGAVLHPVYSPASYPAQLSAAKAYLFVIRRSFVLMMHLYMLVLSLVPKA
jgi:hypothetical protein